MAYQDGPGYGPPLQPGGGNQGILDALVAAFNDPLTVMRRRRPPRRMPPVMGPPLMRPPMAPPGQGYMGPRPPFG